VNEEVMVHWGGGACFAPKTKRNQLVCISTYSIITEHEATPETFGKQSAFVCRWKR
jgi:hypothetical protein